MITINRSYAAPKLFHNNNNNKIDRRKIRTALESVNEKLLNYSGSPVNSYMEAF